MVFLVGQGREWAFKSTVMRWREREREREENERERERESEPERERGQGIPMFLWKAFVPFRQVRWVVVGRRPLGCVCQRY